MNARRILVAALVVFAGAFASPWMPTAALAQIYDARGMAMGNVTLPGPRNEGARVNPAYRAVPPAPGLARGWSFPLPIGLLQTDIPELDPDDDDFDLIEVANFAMNIPWTLEFGADDPPPIDLEVGIAQNSLTLDLNEAQEYVPEEGFDFGGYRTLFDLGWQLNLGNQLGVLYLGFLQGFATHEANFDLDDNLVGVLADAEPIVGGATYRMSGDGMAQVGLGTGLAYAREIPLGVNPTVDGENWQEDYWSADADRPRLWVGMGVRRYFGLGYTKVDGDVELTGQEPLFAAEENFDVGYEALYTTAYPKGLTGLGQATALDLGTVMRWKNWEVGAGVADLFAELSWSNSQVDRYAYDPVDDLVRKTRIGDSIKTKTELPVSWRVNTLYNRGSYLFAADVTGGPGGPALHAGAETWVSGVLALRAGLERDTRSKFQAGWGIGLQAKKVGLDIGFRTHSQNVSGDRQVSMGVALVLR